MSIFTVLTLQLFCSCLYFKRRELWRGLCIEPLNEMVDKPYGINERVERITISIDGGLYDKLSSLRSQLLDSLLL